MGDVNTREVITVEQGMLDAGFTITSKAWLDAYDARFEKAKKEYLDDISKKANGNHSHMIGLMFEFPFLHSPASRRTISWFFFSNSVTSGEVKA